MNPSLTNHGFTGHRDVPIAHDKPGANYVGLTYLNARYYLPKVGRYVSPDCVLPKPVAALGASHHTIKVDVLMCYNSGTNGVQEPYHAGS